MARYPFESYMDLLHDVPGAPILHERYICGISSEPGWRSVATPDFDEFMELMDLMTKPDIILCRPIVNPGSLPAGIAAGHRVHGFGAPLTRVEMDAFNRNGQVLPDAHSINAGRQPYVAPAAAAAVVAPPGLPPPAVAPVAPVALAAAPLVVGARALAVGGSWIFNESVANVNEGDDVPIALLNAGILCQDRGVVSINTGGLAIVRIAGGPTKAALQRGDIRTIPVQLDAQGNLHRAFEDAISRMANLPLLGAGMNLAGPPSAIDICRAMASRSQTPSAHCDSWIARLPENKPSIGLIDKQRKSILTRF